MTKALTRSELNAIVRKSGKKLKNGQFILTKPLKVFKKIYYTHSHAYGRTACIANLIIPVGAVVNLCQDGDGKKFRASQAYCHSIAEIGSKRQLAEGYSGYTTNFKYYSGKKLGLVDSDFEDMVRDAELYERQQYTHQGRQKVTALKKCKAVPDSFSSSSTSTCSAGIHFFHELQSALTY